MISVGFVFRFVLRPHRFTKFRTRIRGAAASENQLPLYIADSVFDRYVISPPSQRFAIKVVPTAGAFMISVLPFWLNPF